MLNNILRDLQSNNNGVAFSHSGVATQNYFFHPSFDKLWNIFAQMPDVTEEEDLTLFGDIPVGTFYYPSNSDDGCIKERKVVIPTTKRKIKPELIDGIAHFCTPQFFRGCNTLAKNIQKGVGLGIYTADTPFKQRLLYVIAYLVAKGINKEVYLQSCFANKNAQSNFLKRPQTYQGVFVEIEKCIAEGTANYEANVLGSVSSNGALNNINAAEKGFEKAYENMSDELMSYEESELAIFTTDKVINNYRQSLKNKSQRNFDITVNGVENIAWNNIPIKPIRYAQPKYTDHVWGVGSTRIILGHESVLAHAFDTDSEDLFMEMQYDKLNYRWQVAYALQTAANIVDPALVSVVS